MPLGGCWGSRRGSYPSQSLKTLASCPSRRGPAQREECGAVSPAGLPRKWVPDVSKGCTQELPICAGALGKRPVGGAAELPLQVPT